MSTDDGANWRSFQLNLPEVPITDLALKDNDLIVATQGRSFWLLDDLDVFWQGLEDFDAARPRLFQPHPTVGYGGGNGSESVTAGTNHPAGVRVNYHMPEGVEDATLTFRDSRGAEIRSYDGGDLDIAAGLNHFDWDMRYEKADDFDGLLMWWGTLNGPVAPPGNYTVELALDRDTLVSSFEVLMDPRAECTREDRILQFEFLKSIRDKVDETHDAIRHMRSVKSQSSGLLGRLDEDDYPAIFEEARALDSLMTAVEEVLYQTKLKSNQDMLNFPIKLNNKLAHVGSLASMGGYAPTEQMVGVRDEVTALIDAELAKWHTLRDERLPAFNALIRDSAIDLIGVPEE